MILVSKLAVWISLIKARILKSNFLLSESVRGIVWAIGHWNLIMVVFISCCNVLVIVVVLDLEEICLCYIPDCWKFVKVWNLACNFTMISLQYLEYSGISMVLFLFILKSFEGCSCFCFQVSNFIDFEFPIGHTFSIL